MKLKPVTLNKEFPVVILVKYKKLTEIKICVLSLNIHSPFRHSFLWLKSG